MTNLIWSSKWV